MLTHLNKQKINALMITVTGMLFFAPVTQAATLTQKNHAVTETLFAQTKPQCIGRYLIDVPASFNNQVRDMVFIDDFKIESQPLYLPAFEQRINLRERGLREAINKPGNKPENTPYLKEVIQLPDNKGVIFDHNESATVDIYRQLEAHVYVGMIAFTITTEIRDFSDAKHHDKKVKYLARGFTEAQTNNKPMKLAAMQSLISRLSGRKDEVIPTEKGVCIPNGFIRDDGGVHTEKLTFRYENDDFIFGLEMDNTEKGSSDTLFNRSAQINEARKLTPNKYSMYKKELSPGGIPSQEWLFGGKQNIEAPVTREKEVVSIYDFILYANEAISSPTKPWLSVGLNSEYKNTHYNEAQMIEIWDRLVNSLRYRPGAF